MPAHPLLPDPNCLTLDALSIRNDTIVFAVRTTRSSGNCPICQCASDRVHSQYRRKLLDLPWQGNAARVELTARKFFCDNRECERRIFTEPLPTVVTRYSRKTARLTDALRELTYLAWGEAAARMARAFGLLVSPDALLDGIKKTPSLTGNTPRVLGVDDFAFKRGRRYGTILVDLERRCPVDLLPDRNADTLATWLRAHPGIEIVSRDRAEVYRNGVTAGAPDAVQVADRWHLLKNLGDTLERFLHRQHRPLVEAARLSEQSTGAIETETSVQKQPIPNCLERESAQRLQKREARHQRVQE